MAANVAAQLSLLPARGTGSGVADTSRESFERIQPSLEEREYQVFRALVKYLATGYADATGAELAAYMGIDKTQVRPRLTQMEQKKWLVKCPARRSRAAGETRAHGYAPCVPLAAVERVRNVHRSK